MIIPQAIQELSILKVQTTLSVIRPIKKAMVNQNIPGEF